MILVEDAQSFSVQYEQSFEPYVEGAILSALRRRLAPRWRSVDARGAPPALLEGNAYADASKVLVFGVATSGGFAGGWFDPTANLWTSLPIDQAPSLDRFGAWVWVRDRLFVVTAGKATWLRSGGWEAAPVDGLPNFAVGGSPGCVRMAASPDEVMLWGSRLFNDTPVSLGAVFSLADGTWRPVNAAGAPDARCYAAVHWTGSEFVVAGSDGSHRAYYPQGAGLWTTIPTDALVVGGSNEIQLVDVAMFDGRHTVAVRSSSGVARFALETADLSWKRTDSSEPLARGVASVQGRAEIRFGGMNAGADDRLIDDGTIRFAAPIDALDQGAGTIAVPPTSQLSARGRPLVAYLPPSSVFVWGGCVRYVDGRCATHAADGAVLDAVLGR